MSPDHCYPGTDPTDYEPADVPTAADLELDRGRCQVCGEDVPHSGAIALPDGTYVHRACEPDLHAPFGADLEPGEGAWWDVDEREYHASEHASRGALETLRRSPAEYFGRYIECSIPDEETAALRFGRLLHLAVLEPDRYARLVTVRPDVDGRTKKGKATLNAWRESQPKGAIECKADERDQIVAMSHAIASHPLASHLCSGLDAYRERSIVWREPTTGLLVRTRPDIAAKEQPLAADIKSFGDTPTPEAFTREVMRHWYHGQAALYLDSLTAVTGEEHERFPFVVVHKEPPYEVAVYELGPEEIELGRREYIAALRELAWRRENNDWQADWQREPKVLTFAGWAFRNSNDWSNDHG